MEVLCESEKYAYGWVFDTSRTQRFLPVHFSVLDRHYHELYQHFSEIVAMKAYSAYLPSLPLYMAAHFKGITLVSIHG